MPSLQYLSGALNRLHEPEIICEPALCSRVRWRNSHCNLCQEGCAPRALHFTPHLELDEARCTNCSLCISLCPNGVFWSRQRGDPAIAQEIARLLSENGTDLVAFGCARRGQADKDIIFLPCLGRLTENLLLAPFALGAIQVEIKWPECDGCAQEKCLSHLEAVFFLSKKLAAMVGREETCIKVLKVGRYFQAQPPLSRRLSRGDFFRHLGGEAARTVVAFLPGLVDGQKDRPWVHMVGAKRAHLLKLVRGFPQHTPTCMVRDRLPLAEVEIRHGCVGCPVCSTLCPTGALERAEGEGIDIYFRPDICVGCGVCQQACLFRAIVLLPTLDLSALAKDERQLKAHLGRRACHYCGSEFMGMDGDSCPSCRFANGGTAPSCQGGS